MSVRGWLLSIMLRGMVIDVNDKQVHPLAQLQGFLDGTVTIEFSVATNFISRAVRRLGYAGLNRTDKAVGLRFLERVSGILANKSRGLLNGAVSGARLPSVTAVRAPALRTSYTSADVLLLAHTDTLARHPFRTGDQTAHGAAHHVFGDTRYERLASISAAQLYSLHKRAGYLRQR